MANELTLKNEFNKSVMDLENTQRVCKMLMQQPHFRKLGEDGIFAISMKARSLGVDLFDACSGLLYYVQGRVGMSTELMATLIRQSGHSVVKDPKSDNTICILHGKRNDNGDHWTVSFSMEDARRAGLAKNMYDKYPGVMLYNRAMSMLARQLFPDVIKGCGYTYEELQEIKESKQSYNQNYSIPAVAELIDDNKTSLITQNQAEELNVNFSLSSPDFKTKVMEWLKISNEKEFLGVVKNKPSTCYEGLLAKLKESATQYQMSLTQQSEASKEVVHAAA